MFLQLPAPALHTSTWQAGHVSFQLLPRAYPFTLRERGLQQLCWATRQSQLPSIPQAHFRALSNPLHGSLCQGRLVPLPCFTEKEKCVTLSDIPYGSPNFSKITHGTLAVEKTLCRAKTPVHLTQNHPTWSPQNQCLSCWKP